MKEEKVKWKRIKERIWDERESEMGEIEGERMYDEIEN